MTIVPGLLRRLEAEAPGVDLVVVPYAQDIARRIEDGSLDFAFGLEGSPLPAGAVSFPVARDTLALVMRRKHPAAKRDWTFEDYARFDHAAVSIFGDGRSELDARLAQAGLSRRIALTTPHFMAALAAVAASDLVTTISRRLAQRFAKTLDVILKDPPFDAPVMVNTLVTAAARAQDPALLWFCELGAGGGESDLSQDERFEPNAGRGRFARCRKSLKPGLMLKASSPGRKAGQGRWELREGAAVPMSPERAIHALTKLAAQETLKAAIAKAALPCRLFPDGMTVRINPRNAYEPDALVVCPPPPRDAVEIPNPIIVVEVLSPGTAAHDHGAKLDGYFSLPSVMHYLILDPDRAVLIHHKRGQAGAIETRILREGVLRLDPPGIEADVKAMFVEG